MNHRITAILFFTSALIVSSCTREQESLFEQPAAIRLNHAIENIDSTLVNAPNGWIMQYFATNESPGYSLLVNFSSTGEVLVAAKNNLVRNRYTEARSVYRVIGDYGPVLTFDTFNNLLHLFSTPENPAGQGLGGDYEFIINTYSDSLIQMNGKKRGTLIDLERIPEDKSWADIIAQLESMTAYVAGSDRLYLVSGNNTRIIEGSSSFVYEISMQGSDEPIIMPYIVTRDGIKLHKPIKTARNTEVQHFVLSPERDKLVASSDPQTYITGSDIVPFITNNQTPYEFDLENSSSHFTNPAFELIDEMHSRYSGRRDIDFLAITYRPDFGHSFTFSTKPTLTVANFRLYLLAHNNRNTISIDREINGYDQNGELFYTNVNSIEKFWKELPGVYELRSTLSKNSIIFIDIENETRYFKLNKR